MTKTRGRGPQRHWSIYGTTRTGKTVLTRKLLADSTPRYVVLDRNQAYHDLGTVATTFAAARDYLDTCRGRKRLRLIVAAVPMEVHYAVIRYLWTLHETFELRPTALVMDEAHKLFERRQWPTEPETIAADDRGYPYLKRVYVEGLQRKLVALTVTQFPRMLPNTARECSEAKVAFRNSGRLPPDIRTAFGDRADDISELTTLTPGDRPKKGTHFLTYPPDLRVPGDWRAEVR